MDTGTGVSHSSEATCKIHHGNGQSADVPGSAQTPDLPHARAGHQYDRLQANDSATVIQGNVTINCTHSHGGLEKGGLRGLSKSKTSGDTDPLHKARNRRPRRASLDCPRTLPFPETFPARATPSFTGLNDIEDSARSSISWKADFEKEATRVQVVIEDAGKGGVSFTRPWAHGAKVSLETQDAVRKSCQIRRLKITTTKSSVLWLPETGVRVKLIGKSVEAKFSNCNKLQSPGQFVTDNGRRKSVTTYDPEAPNVGLDIDFGSVEAATGFSRILLCRPLAGDAADQALQKVGNCTFMRQSHDIGEKEPGDIIHVWKEETDPEGETYEVHDRVSFSDILDLDVSVANQHVRLSFGYMDRLQYGPAWDHPKLPQDVKRTADGGPGSVSYQGAEFPTSRLELVTPSTDLEVQQLLKCLAGNKLSWQFEAMFLQRNIKISPSSKVARVLSRSKEYLTQVTLWSNDDKLRILMRALDPDDRNDFRPHLPKWYAITLRKNEVPLKASLKQGGEIVLTTEQVNFEDGNCLSTKDLRPHTTSTGTGRTEPRPVDLELRFADIPEWARFRKVVSNVYLNVASSNEENASFLGLGSALRKVFPIFK